MTAVIEIDKAGRIVVPKKLRDAMHLTPGTRLRVRRSGDALVLDPDFPQAHLVIEDGTPLIYPASMANTPIRDPQFYVDLIDKDRAERDRHSTGLYDDEIEV